MSDNVTPLHPEKMQRRRIQKRVFYFLGVLLLVVATLCLILFHQELNLDKIRRYITYLNVRDSSTYGTYAFDAHNSNTYHAFDSGLAVSSVAGLDIYDAGGKEIASVPNAVSVPAIEAGKKLILAYDVGGTTLSAAGAGAGAVLNEDTGKPILDADISADDQICYTTASDGYKTVLTVLDNQQNEIYQWLSSSQYFSMCSVADGGKLAAAVALGQTGGVFESKLQFFPTDQEEPGPSVSLGNQLILDLNFIDSKRICAVGETSLRFFDTNAKPVGEYDYQDAYLKDFDLSGNGFAALSMNMYQAGSRYSVVTVGWDGKELANQYIGEEILSISAAGNYVAVLTANSLKIFTSDLTLYAQTQEVLGASHVAMRDDGSALLIGSGSAHLYLP